MSNSNPGKTIADVLAFHTRMIDLSVNDGSDMKAFHEGAANTLSAGEELFVPGAWICDGCQFTLNKFVMRASDGAIGVQAQHRYDVEICPNDTRIMRRLTWRESRPKEPATDYQMNSIGDVHRAVTGLTPSVASACAGMRLWNHRSDPICLNSLGCFKVTTS